MLTPNLEGITSWFSGLILTYLDPLVVFANKILHLRHNKPPFLSDDNSARRQATTAFSVCIRF